MWLTKSTENINFVLIFGIKYRKGAHMIELAKNIPLDPQVLILDKWAVINNGKNGIKIISYIILAKKNS